MIAFSGICQSGTQQPIDYRALMKDVLRLDSCLAVSQEQEQVYWYKDSLLEVCQNRIKTQESNITTLKTITDTLTVQLDKCTALVQSLSTSEGKWEKWWVKVCDPFFLIPSGVAALGWLLVFIK